MRPSFLLNRLGEPGTGRALQLCLHETSLGEPYNGLLLNPDGEFVGRLEDFRFRFVNFAPGREADLSRPLSEARPVPVRRAIALNDACVHYTGDWRALDELMVTDGVVSDSQVSLTSSAPLLELVLQKHPWSGLCALYIGDALFEQVDCFNAFTAIPYRVRLPLPGVPTEVSVRPLGRRCPESMGNQVIIEGFAEHGPATTKPGYQKHPATNRGGAFHPRFFEIASDLPADALILDVGGGKRQLADERYVNLEYSAYDEPDMFGDGTALPFRTGSVDFVYSAAVLEHVPDPRKMGAEIVRVLKPGGVALINSAFMQPIHSEGQHFFNATPYGLELALTGLDKRAAWVIGDLSSTLDWFLKVTHVHRAADPADLTKFMEIAKRLDRCIPPDRLPYIASGVWFEGVKPTAA
jgi:SAM-dependent methyltransferase